MSSSHKHQGTNNILIHLHNAIVPQPLEQHPCISPHEVVEILAAIIRCQSNHIRHSQEKPTN